MEEAKPEQFTAGGAAGSEPSVQALSGGTGEGMTVRLDYARLGAGRRRRVVRWVFLTLGALLVGMAFLVLANRLFSDRIRLLLAQRAAMEVTYPPTQVAWEEDPEEIRKLAGSSKYGPGWATLSSGAKTNAYFPVPSATRTLFMIPGTTGPGISPIFAHGRDAGRGRRLVYVAIEGRPYAFSLSQQDALTLNTLTIITMKPAGVLSGAVFSRVGWSDRKLNAVPPGQLRFFWGQIDPLDARHFTIGYQTPAGRGTLDGYLQSDDTVKLTVRDGPAAEK
ncbi:MAG: hypothetical protein ACM359_18110 [Bacillota bacterium]